MSGKRVLDRLLQAFLSLGLVVLLTQAVAAQSHTRIYLPAVLRGAEPLPATVTPPGESTPAATAIPTATATTAATPTASPPQLLAVAPGMDYSCALSSAGAVKCWGRNHSGQLGDGTDQDSHVPVDVLGLDHDVVTLASGGQHTCALTQEGAVKCWGRNHSGQLGDGSKESRSAPVDVLGLQGGITDIAAGVNHSCALTQQGSVMCWGYNLFGGLGDGTYNSSLVPVNVTGISTRVVAVAAGMYYTCALTQEGAVKCWGYNSLGQLGDGTREERYQPVDVVGLESGVVAIDAGASHACALTQHGVVKCWGRNSLGQLGDGTKTDRLTPVTVLSLSTTSTLDISGGSNHTCALTQEGTIKCWGSNSVGQMGDGVAVDYRLAPVDVSGLTNVAGLLEIGPGSGANFSVTEDGSIICWGQNEYGQLGNGSMTNSYTPTTFTILNKPS